MHDSLGWAPERGEEMFHNYTETKAVAGHPRIKVLYWMHRARRDLVLQSSLSSMQTSGTFGLRSSVRPNPIASSIVQLIAIDGVWARLPRRHAAYRPQTRTHHRERLADEVAAVSSAPPRSAPASRDKGRGTVASNSRFLASR